MSSGRLRDLVDQVTTKAHGRKSAEFPYVGLENIEPGGRTLTGTAPSSVSQSTNGVFKNGDILFGKLRPNLRKAVQVDFGGYCSTDLLVLRPRTGVDVRYAGHVSASEAVFRHAERNSIGTGMPRTSWHAVRQAPAWVPPLEEQRRIAEVLDTIDEAIQSTERLIAKLDRASIALSQVSFSQVRTDESVRLGGQCRILGGKRLPYGHSYAATLTQYRYLRVVDFYKRNVDYKSLSALSESTFEALNPYEIRSGELFISIAGSIGHVGVNDPPTGMRTVLTENAARIVPSRSLIPDFLALQMNSPGIMDQVRAEIGTGGGVPKLALHRIANIRVRCPELDIQNEIVHRHRTERSARDSEVRRLDKLRGLRSGLVADLLSGRVRTAVA